MAEQPAHPTQEHTVVEHTEASGQCAVETASDPLIIVIFGATGDLTGRKVFPALAALVACGEMPEPFRIVGASRTDLSDDEFRERMKASLEQYRPELLKNWDDLAPNISHADLKDYSDPKSYTALAKTLKKLHSKAGTQGNTLFYLAVPPTVYEDIAIQLGKAGLARESTDGNGLMRLVVEKPFGHDLASARELDAVIHRHFQEHQVFRTTWPRRRCRTS